MRIPINLRLNNLNFEFNNRAPPEAKAGMGVLRCKTHIQHKKAGWEKHFDLAASELLWTSKRTFRLTADFELAVGNSKMCFGGKQKNTPPDLCAEVPSKKNRSTWEQIPATWQRTEK